MLPLFFNILSNVEQFFGRPCTVEDRGNLTYLAIVVCNGLSFVVLTFSVICFGVALVLRFIFARRNLCSMNE